MATRRGTSRTRSSSATTPRRRRSTCSPSSSPTSCATRRSRSTPPTLATRRRSSTATAAPNRSRRARPRPCGSPFSARTARRAGTPRRRGLAPGDRARARSGALAPLRPPRDRPPVVAHTVEVDASVGEDLALRVLGRRQDFGLRRELRPREALHERDVPHDLVLSRRRHRQPPVREVVPQCALADEPVERRLLVEGELVKDV